MGTGAGTGAGMMTGNVRRLIPTPLATTGAPVWRPAMCAGNWRRTGAELAHWRTGANHAAESRTAQVLEFQGSFRRGQGTRWLRHRAICGVGGVLKLICCLYPYIRIERYDHMGKLEGTKLSSGQAMKSRRVNRTGLAKMFGVSLSIVDSWLRQGCPCIRKPGQSGGEWELDAPQVGRWLLRGGAGKVSSLDLPSDFFSWQFPAEIAPEELARIDRQNSTQQHPKRQKHPMSPRSESRTQSAARLNQSVADSDEFQRLMLGAMESARRAQPFFLRAPGGDEEKTQAVKQSMVRGVVACLKTGDLPGLFDEGGTLIRTPGAVSAASTIRLEAGTINTSRIASAGSHIIVRPEQAHAIATGVTGLVAMESIASDFRAVEAAIYGTVAGEGDAPVIAYPVGVAHIDWDQAVAKGFRLEIPRSGRLGVGSGVICREIGIALGLGLGRAADEALLSKIIASNPTPFTLAKAAAQGLKFGELRGLVGIAGNGAIISPSGDLRAAGIPSELTGDMTATIVGAFDRAAVAIYEKVDVHFERTDTNGSLSVTVWAHLVPLLPDPEKFWVVGA